jgi:hypothetical protein
MRSPGATGASLAAELPGVGDVDGGGSPRARLHLIWTSRAGGGRRRLLYLPSYLKESFTLAR